MSWGGRRAGAGRKSNAETERCRAMLDKSVSEADWDAIFKNQARIASTGDGPAAVQAAKFLARYRWGEPISPEPEPDEIEPISIIEVKNPPQDCDECAIQRRLIAEGRGEELRKRVRTWADGPDNQMNTAPADNRVAEGTGEAESPSQETQPAEAERPSEETKHEEPRVLTPEEIEKRERANRLFHRRKWGNWTPLPRPKRAT